MREFEILDMKEGKSVDEYLARVLSIANKMNIHIERMEEVVVVEKVLRCMPPKYNYIWCVLY